MKPFTYILSGWLCLALATAANSQTAALDNKVSESITFHEEPKGPTLYGIFQGRTPCFNLLGIAASTPPAGCDHLKWSVIFFKDPVTSDPTTFQLTTELFNYLPLKGKWKMVRDIKAHPNTTIYVLTPEPQNKPIYLLKGDENVLFILDEHFAFRTGNLDFTYTLNRVHPVL